MTMVHINDGPPINLHCTRSMAQQSHPGINGSSRNSSIRSQFQKYENYSIKNYMKTASNATEKHHGLLTNSVINYELLV